MALNYVVSAQKPTIVTGAVVGNFTAPNDLNLVIAKTNRLEILLVTAEGLKPTQEVPIFGRIAAIKFFRPRGENTDSLLILTAKYHLAVLSWSESGEIVTRAHGNLADRIGRQSETGIIAIVDEPSGLIALRLYDGLLKVVQWEDGRELKAFNLRFEDLNIVDVQFLHNCDKPTIAYIYQDQNGRHLKTALVSVDEKELVMGPWKQDNIESEATMLIPIPAPFGGCVLIGQESISYHKDENVYTAVAPPLIHQSTITCFGKIDKTGQRFLLGDMAGRLFMLLLDTVEGMDGMASVKDLKVELLGETTIAECLVYLDNGVVFVGSRLGDSQLIRLTTEPVDIETNSFVQVLDSYTNLGPILDMALVRLEGQSQVVTCSGAFKEGSLRVVRNGIGIEEHASVDLPGVKGLFAFQKDSQDGFDNYLLVSFVGETRVLMLAGDELEETEIPGIVSDEQTLWAGSLSSPERLVQVTPAGVRMVTGENTVLWSPPESKRISLMSANALTGQLTIACGRDLFYLELTDAVTQIAHVQTDHEIACVDISPIGETNRSEVVAVGLWTDISVRLLSLPDLVEIHAQPLGGEILPRSVLMTRLESSLYLLVALGDGTLFYYQMDTQTGALLERKKVTLGTQPTTLKKFKSRGTTNVFACSDRPTVIYSSNQKLVFSNVNLKLVAHMCPLNAAAYRDSLVMSDGQTLVIGTIISFFNSFLCA
uniref:DNA damage-binding protein 1 n=1 Tax=Plectus sambesii TaxID=2011161 RepID=A0A914W414_9BILA